MLVIWYK